MKTKKGSVYINVLHGGVIVWMFKNLGILEQTFIFDMLICVNIEMCIDRNSIAWK